MERDRFKRNCSPPDAITWANMNSSEFEELFSSIATGSCPDSDYANKFSNLPRTGFHNCMTEFSEAIWDGQCSSPVADSGDEEGTTFHFEGRPDGRYDVFEVTRNDDGTTDIKHSVYDPPDEFSDPEPIIIEINLYPEPSPSNPPDNKGPDDSSSVSMASNGGLSVTGGNLDGIGAGSGGCGRYQPVDRASVSYFISNYTHPAYPVVPTEGRGEVDAFTALLHCQCQSASSMISGQQRASLGCPKQRMSSEWNVSATPLAPMMLLSRNVLTSYVMITLCIPRMLVGSASRCIVRAIDF